MSSSRNALVGWAVLHLVRWGLVRRRRSTLRVVGRVASIVALLAVAAAGAVWYLRRRDTAPTGPDLP